MPSNRKSAPETTPVTFPIDLDATDLRPLAERLATLVDHLKEYESARALPLASLALRSSWSSTALAAIAVEEELQRIAPTDPDAIAPQIKGASPRVRAFMRLYEGLKGSRVRDQWKSGPAPDLSCLVSLMQLAANMLPLETESKKSAELMQERWLPATKAVEEAQRQGFKAELKWVTNDAARACTALRFVHGRCRAVTKRK